MKISRIVTKLTIRGAYLALFSTAGLQAAYAQSAAEMTRVDESFQQMIVKSEVETALSCWARGMDLTLRGNADAALAAWNDCYAHPDYQFRVFFQGQTIEGMGAEGRAQSNVQTGGMFGYVNAYHFISNVEVTAADENSASAVALQTADHFREDGTVERTWGVIAVEFVRDDAGKLLAVDETMDIRNMSGFTGLPAPAAMLQQQ